jgi:peptidoglycan/LPS O-acetylase OafA/YrhL
MSEGKFLLKAISVLMMVFGLVVAIYAIVYIVTPEDVDNWTTAAVLLIITCLLEFIFGIIGFRSSDDPGRAMFFIVTGLIAAILAIISMFMAITQWTVVSLVLPVYYIVGGVLLRKAAD